MMTKESLAEKLNGSQYGSALITAVKDEAKAAGLVIVTGYSDDNVEFNGAIYDEAGAYDGATIYIQNGKIFAECDDPCDHCFMSDEDPASVADAVIEAEWDSHGYNWYISAEKVPFAVFDVMEDGGPHTRGIVFDLKDIK